VANRFRGELYRWHVLERRRRGGAGEQWHVGQRRRGAGAAEKGATLLVVAGFEPLQFATPRWSTGCAAWTMKA
jgi:AraC family carnitine catabolism transcriptional activator